MTKSRIALLIMVLLAVDALVVWTITRTTLDVCTTEVLSDFA